ncbi:HAD family hydrolase [Litoreibacter janthinus]|uniref:Haloacid dehalogenase-like hydrolase n=1 Tax=Litoreibacter janthinus TaxID=670154 RepID=A0A1I6HP85_9RHOB|nr:HAD family hydrolase [Litoreibacter janthinus]SFR56194.1 haloacid dehalogenase-like hydrolase [Litoreibacter janthinus]
MKDQPRFEQNIVALVYDFDGTLSPEAMQHYGVLPSLELTPEEFWGKVKSERKENRSEELLVYMREMINLADHKKVKLDRKTFQDHGATVKFFEGVTTWFDRINKFTSEISEGSEIKVEHYIISSGLKEMIEGCAIADQFKEIFACEFSYDQYGHPDWPSRVISDTSKTQYLFRINKGVLDVNESINSHMPNEQRRIPFDNMIYFGDGDTDVPSMAVMMGNGGHAVAVHSPNENSEKCLDLKKAKRIDYYCPADYSEGSELDRLVKATLRVIVSRIALRQEIFELPPVGKI